jgi:hypothetical protein
VISNTDIGFLVGERSTTMEWKLIDTAPFDRDLELAVIDSPHALAKLVA